ncbi:E3 ubiquitin/ISG15 ligase TRIM25 [Xyrichtys novacula]|uniref:E3 ubiquitin/ISG15 ligase TRIM25 n=1 Tax=Xyrichtys novacula TaxID=13765 RepID=A0AAV1F660_XYRNO|nr:E3 ubiquitin/ISG15 ligase TRIM25 [Xyrichtys novacula]
MGAILDTPAKCPLCNELTGEPVTLKCNHRFCQRCIGDLWSVNPNGPYHCPEWRCKTVYQTLPFDRSFTRPPTNSRRAQPRSNAGSSSSDDQNPLGSILRRPSLSSRLLGKRKASTPPPEQPNTKRSSLEVPHENRNDETPTTSLSDPTTSRAAAPPESAQSEQSDGAFSSDISDSQAVPPADVHPAGDTSGDAPVQQNRRESVEEILLDDSDTSNEVDICDAPLFETPKKDTHVTSGNASPAVLTPHKEKSPVHDVSKSSPTFPKHPATSPASSSHVGLFPRSETKNSHPVPCHYCPKSMCQTAVKTCLVCGASMCKEHLRPHLDSPVFQNHTLVPPMEDISSWRCQEHQEINRIYCRQCGVCVCTVCTVIGSHRDHVCISIREAERELRGNLKAEIRQLQVSEEEVKNKVSELTQKKETFKVVLNESRAAVQQQYGAIREALEQEEQSALNCVSKEENRVVGGLEEKLSQLRSSLQSIQKGLYTLEGLADNKGDKHVQDQAFIMEYSKVAQLAGNTGNPVDQLGAPEEVDRARLKCLQRWTEKRLDSVVITVPGEDRDLFRLLCETSVFLYPHLFTLLSLMNHC